MIFIFVDLRADVIPEARKKLFTGKVGAKWQGIPAKTRA